MSLNRRLATAGAVLCAVSFCAVQPASAQPGHSPSTPVQPPPVPAPLELLRQAATALDNGEYQRAVDLAARVVISASSSSGDETGLTRQDRAEAWRVYGLALFFLDRHDDAEAAFLQYLKLDVEARLDPALVPPEAVVFFEEVASKHAAELRKYRPQTQNQALLGSQSRSRGRPDTKSRLHQGLADRGRGRRAGSHSPDDLFSAGRLVQVGYGGVHVGWPTTFRYSAFFAKSEYCVRCPTCRTGGI